MAAYSPLRIARQMRGWTLEDSVNRLHALSRRELGVDAHMLGRWERGVRRPSARYVRLLCQLYELSADGLGLMAETPAPVKQPIHDKLDDVKRRQLLHLLAVTPFVDVERLLNPSMESQVLPDLLRITRSYIVMRETMSVATLHPQVVAHLSVLQGLLGQSLSADARRQLQLIASETAVLAARDENQMSNRGNAWHFLRYADDLAREAGDDNLRARVLAMRSGMFQANSGGRGDPHEAVAKLNAAWGLVENRGLPEVRAYVLALRAEQQAGAGDAEGFDRGMDAARELMMRYGPFLGSVANPRSQLELDAIAGNALVLLGRTREAIDVLDRVHHEMTSGPAPRVSWPLTIRIDRAYAVAQQGDVGAAVLDLGAVLGQARAQQSWHNVERIEATWRKLPDSPGTRALHEALIG